MANPALSIITVCYRARDAVQRTAENILRQSFRDFEYLVIDGGSEDGTPEYLAGAAEVFAKAGLSFRYVSEPDRGIYDAMNKGVRLARGEWLLFLNAGDLLVDSEVLAQIFQEPADAQILYGDTTGVYQGRKRHYPALPLARLNREMAFCHQSAFIRRELLLQEPYDISYKVCADHRFFLSMYLQGKRFSYRPLTVSVYEISGYSDQNKRAAHLEQLRMQRELGVFRVSPGWLFGELRFYAKQAVKAVCGQRLIDLVRRKRSDNG